MGRTVLITGATGLIGARLAARVLECDGRGRVVAPVRATSEESALRRVVAALETVLDRPLPHEWLDRITALPGDVTLARMGLDCADYNRLARTVSHVVHCAAATSFTQSYDAARLVNVRGTQIVCRFAEIAKRIGRLAAFVHVSTAYVNEGGSRPVGEDYLDEHPTFHNAYDRSKWEAERYVRACRERLPLIIVRPSIVIGDSHSGATIGFNTLYIPIRLLCDGLVTALPTADDGCLDVVPVDFVAAAIFHLMNDSAHVGHTYHLTAGLNNAVRCGEIAEMVVHYLGVSWQETAAGEQNHRTRHTGIAEGSLSRNRVNRALAQLVPYMCGEWRFDTTNTDAALRTSGIHCRCVRDYLPTVLDYFLSRRGHRALSKVA